MAIEEFTWSPRINMPGATDYGETATKFGDGYEQVSRDGLNPRKLSFDVSFVGKESYIKEIKDFLDKHGGAKAFAWRPPLEPLGLYLGSQVKITAMGGDNYTLAATFKQAYRP